MNQTLKWIIYTFLYLIGLLGIFASGVIMALMNKFVAILFIAGSGLVLLFARRLDTSRL